eukprot:917963-Prymnesium_polylepis.1
MRRGRTVTPTNRTSWTSRLIGGPVVARTDGAQPAGAAARRAGRDRGETPAQAPPSQKVPTGRVIWHLQ